METATISVAPRMQPSGEEVHVLRHEDTLTRLAMNDERFVERLLAMRCGNVQASGLEPKVHALARLGALIALDAAPSSYQSNVEMALAAGATVDEIVGVLVAVAPTVGLARVVSAASELAIAIGYDIDSALETLDAAGGA